jgi:hypothetical protein
MTDDKPIAADGFDPYAAFSSPVPTQLPTATEGYGSPPEPDTAKPSVTLDGLIEARGPFTPDETDTALRETMPRALIRTSAQETKAGASSTTVTLH